MNIKIIRKKELKISFLWFLIGLFYSCNTSADQVDFSTQIKPILNSKCITCHGGVKKSGGFSLLFEDEAFAVTESGKPAIIPGNAAGSEFIRRLKEDDPELRMPYEKPRLSDEEIELLSKWIDQGAKWGTHWAYSLPKEVAVPTIVQKASMLQVGEDVFLQNDIDNFILARLENERVSPNAPADKNVLIRRLAFDITGLPPSERLYSDFTNGNLSYENVVDTLLAQKTFGEKWASWWLDLARYADTKGYEKDNGRTMWRYRDWVIDAFNKDMPYDQFTMEQLAGDLLPNPSVDQLIATAFHRNTMNNDEGGTDDEEFRVAAVIDRVNTTYSVWQSTTMECVQCHSHTYDPFKFEEYYKSLAFFNNTRDEDTPDESPNIRFFDEAQLKRKEALLSWIKQYGTQETAQQYGDFLLFKEPKYLAHNAANFVNGELADTKYLALWKDGSCELKNIHTNGASFMYMEYSAPLNGTVMTIRENNAQGQILAQFGIDKTEGRIIRRIPFRQIEEPVDLFIESKNNAIAPQVSTSYITWFAFLEDIPGEGERGHSQGNETFLDLLNAKTDKLPIMVENNEQMARATQIFERGSWMVLGDTVQPGTPKSLNPFLQEWPQNRLGMSKWLVSKENPLTARTLVNRVWHQIFGRGIVASIEDMGTQSDPPSHPALLDWLSLRFMNEQEWQIKSLVKEIVMSGTYRQSSVATPELYQKDPHNELYARGPRLRLSAEQIRDQALAVSGLLSDKMYGPGVMPPQPEGVWQSVYSNESWVESKGDDRYRRAIYTYLKRTSPYPSFITFDAGSREVCTIRRTVTNTPLQALVTLNDPVYLEAAFELAKIMDREDVEEGIALGFEKAMRSKIDTEKLTVLKNLYDDALMDFESGLEKEYNFMGLKERPSHKIAALTVVANAVMNLDEFLTKA
ncbi:PSD1 and planctomycete cytochrome C domain-containing protein [Arenibacter sp. GZD96]|uniref:PSD1 and planctomycete cytochrome C domain-containing protein n=1 Tax=Aurantibrevibacter litoralis TaxID=3106030 RepID=UPI002AFFF4B0|nr:PSD1 and planctomycete cytochrome C domain-containing protein [Arenibacter sp. GZD-96]MEA1784692.1 PSD1 and planctomycete cytochrome C domain-containing protein [Arenibacter sp. GZD-96]